MGVGDFVSYMPSWLLIGFGFGAAAGNWRRFGMSMTALLIGVMLTLLLVEVIDDLADGRMFVGMLATVLTSALEQFMVCNVFLIGAVAVVMLRFGTDKRWGWLAVA